jgi:hypothetical protein
MMSMDKAHECVNMWITGRTIFIDLSSCENPAYKKIVLLYITRNQCFDGDINKVEVELGGNNKRYFVISSQLDTMNISNGIYNDRIMQNFRK